MLNVDCRHIHTFDRALYSHLVNYPAEVTSLLDNEARYVLAQLFPDQDPNSFEHFVVCNPAPNIVPALLCSPRASR